MNEVNKTLYIPLYGKAQLSRQGIILHDPMAEKIWNKEAFPIKGKAKSKWLCYNMAMRARVFDDWTRKMLQQHTDAIVLHIGCGLDSRCVRVNASETQWLDCDFPDVIEVRKKYYSESEHYSMHGLDATNQDELRSLPDSACAIVVLEGISMYLTNQQLANMFRLLSEKYLEVHVLMDVYTVFGAKASKYKNPVNDVGVYELYGADSVSPLIQGSKFSLTVEHSFTPDYLVNELSGFDKWFFKMIFSEKLYQKIYRLYELETK